MTSRKTVMLYKTDRSFRLLRKKASLYIKRGRSYTAAVLICALLSGCAESYPIGKSSASAAPFEEVSDDENRCTRECNIELGEEVSVNGSGVWLSGREILIQKGGVYIFSGSTDDCSINVDTGDPVKLVFNASVISNDSGCAVYSRSQKLIVESVGASRLCGCGSDKKTAVYSEGRTLFVGEGSLSVEGGVYSGENIEFGKNTLAEFDGDNEETNIIAGTLTVNGTSEQ